MKRNKLIIALAISLVVGLLMGWLMFHSKDNKEQEQTEEVMEVETTYTCSMHPQIKQNKPGLCPICAMDLVPMQMDDAEHTDPNSIAMSESAMALASIQTSKVVEDYPMHELSVFGKIMPDERKVYSITARYPGRLDELNVNYSGQMVKKGDVLAQIYSPDLLTAQEEFLEAVKQKESSPSIYQAAKKKLELWQLSAEQINELEKSGKAKVLMDVHAPYSGFVSMQMIKEGDYVREGTKLFELQDLSIVWAMFELYESDLSWVKLGDKIKFTTKAYPFETFTASIDFIDPQFDAKKRITYLRTQLSNPKGKLKPNMLVEGVIKSSIAKNTKQLLIPKSAVLWTGKRAIVYVKNANSDDVSFKMREIYLGVEAGEYYVVDAGLTVGEEIVTNGAFKIDAAAQLSGKTSMMNPTGGAQSMAHNHGDMSVSSSSQGPDHNHEIMDHSKHNMKTESMEIAVKGNCSMCKTTIEKAANNTAGVMSAEWDTESKVLSFEYNPDEFKEDNLHLKIAKSGYDTEKQKATDEAYDKLPPCCQYDRD